jgi:hypothetical protein
MKILSYAVLAGALAVPVLWAYENWHGKSHLQITQQMLEAKLPNYRQQIKAAPAIPDEQNFWKDPRLDKFRRGEQFRDVPGYGRVFLDGLEFPDARHEVWLAVSQHLAADASKPPWQTVQKVLTEKGIQIPSDEAAAREAILQELQADSDVQQLIAVAKERPSAELSPNSQEIAKIGESVGLFHAPIASLSGVFQLTLNLNCRATVAVALGCPDLALEFLELAERLCSGPRDRGHHLITLLTATACARLNTVGESVAGSAPLGLPMMVRSGLMTEPQLALWQNRLCGQDEDAMVLDRALYREVFVFQAGQQALLKAHFAKSSEYAKTVALLPDGLLDENLANYLETMMQGLVDNTAADDLPALAETLPRIREITREMHAWNPRTHLTAVAVPALSGIAGSALGLQTARRQLIVAIAAHRYKLAHGGFPADSTALAEFLPQPQRDPHNQALSLAYEPIGNTFRVVSSAKEGGVWLN